MYVFMYVYYMHVCMHVCMYMCIYVCMHACMYVCLYVCIHVCMHECMYICMYVWICKCVRLYTIMSMHACIYVCVNRVETSVTQSLDLLLLYFSCSQSWLAIYTASGKMLMKFLSIKIFSASRLPPRKVNKIKMFVLDITKQSFYRHWLP